MTVVGAVLSGLLVMAPLGCSFKGSPGDGATEIDAGDRDALADATISEGDPWLGSYKARRPVRVRNTTKADLNAFPTLVRIAKSDLGTKIGQDGSGLQFASRDAQTVFEHEIDSWDSGEEGTLWVRLDLPMEQESALYLYYDNDSVGDASSGPAVFSDYHAVYHFSEAFRADEEVASAINPDLGLVANNITSNLVAQPIAGPALDFAGSNDTTRLIASAPNDSFRTPLGQSKIYEAWFNGPAGQAGTILDTRSGGNGCEGVSLAISPEMGKLRAQYTLNLDASCGNPQGVFDTVSRDDGQWHHVAYVVNRSSNLARLYVDGTLDPNSQPLPEEDSLLGNELHVGGLYVTSPQQSPFEGRIDEVRIGPSRVEDQAWFKLQYDNVTATGAGSVVKIDAEVIRP